MFSVIWDTKQNLENKDCFPDNIYLFKVNNRKTKKRLEICSKLPIKTPGRRPRRP